jgi:hypothetical protein
MMNATNNIAVDLFYKVRSRFSGLKLGTSEGAITINPEEARFFDFDYKDGEKIVGHVSVSLAEENSMKVYFSTGITESMDTDQKRGWYKFLKELRGFAKRRLMSFDTRDIAKDNLDKRDFAFLSQNSQPKNSQKNIIQKHVGESIMRESAMYGTKTVSYQKLENTRLIIKHNQALQDDMAPGARSRNISGLFVENGDGERFKYPFIHLEGARAMQRHVANSGLPYDDIGKSIISMSEQIAQLRSFSNYVVRNDLMNSSTNGIVEQSAAALQNLREQLHKLTKQKHYEAYKESFQAQTPLEIPQDVVEDFTDKFTVKNFKEDIKAVFPILYRLMQENNSTVDYDDIVAMTTESVNDEAEVDLEEDSVDQFTQFENWVMNLGEDSAIASQDPQEQQAAIREMQELVGQTFPAGVNGDNAIPALRGLIDDPSFLVKIKEASMQDPDADVRGIVQEWLGEIAPDVLDTLDFGDYTNTAPVEGIEEAASGGDYEIDGEMATVEFVRDESGAVQVTKVMIGSTDITAIQDLNEIANNIDENDESPVEDYYLILDIDVEAEYSAAERGAREFGSGMQLEPDYPAYSEISSITAYGNGQSVSLSTDDFPESIQDQIQEIADKQHSDDDDFDIPDNYDRYEGVEEADGPNKSDIPAFKRKEKGGDDWKMSTKDLDDERTKSPTSSAGLARKKKELGMGESSRIDVKEVAEFIHSFYDPESSTFPKSPEGVATMVGKKFGPKAEQAARKMVERMAPQQSTNQNPGLAELANENTELARIKKLSGISQGIGF